MSEQKRRGVVAVAWWVGGLLLLLTLYVASMGPTVWLTGSFRDGGPEPPEWWLILYAPVLRVAGVNETTANWWFSYVIWWADLGR
jgi:hypothetical protein